MNLITLAVFVYLTQHVPAVEDHRRGNRRPFCYPSFSCVILPPSNRTRTRIRPLLVLMSPDNPYRLNTPSRLGRATKRPGTPKNLVVPFSPCCRR